MNLKQLSWAWILALIIGFSGGLAYAWVISPVEYVDAEPQVLRDDFKDHFRSAIAAAYGSNADLERARARLALLGDPNPSQALSAQAQRMVAAGESSLAVQQVAMLASALQGLVTIATQTEVVVIPTFNGEITAQPDDAVTATSFVDATTPVVTEATSTLIPALTATPRPTRTATPTLGAPFQLVGQDTVCDEGLAEGLLQIVVTNRTRQQIPGAEIIITWNGGEEHIFTGLKPELGHGYADFLMAPDVTYSARTADGGTPALELIAPVCTDKDGNNYQGGILITFQQP